MATQVPDNDHGLPDLKSAVTAQWQAWDEAFKVTSRVVAQTANIAARKMHLQDPAFATIFAGPTDKMPPYGKQPYLYPEIAKSAPSDVYRKTLNAAIKRGCDHYMKHRFQIWIGKESVANQKRLPVAIPFENCRLSEEPGGSFLLTAPMGGRRFTLRLCRGKEFVRQADSIKKIISGEIQATQIEFDKVSSGYASFQSLSVIQSARPSETATAAPAAMAAGLIFSVPRTSTD